jgi:hypothetical protein
LQVLIWFGWFGFNGGSALNASLRAFLAAFNTHTSASTGVIGWVTVDYIKHGKKFSVIGCCEGAIAGLVGRNASNQLPSTLTNVRNHTGRWLRLPLVGCCYRSYHGRHCVLLPERQ